MSIQITFPIQPGATEHPSLKACVASAIYRRGVVATAKKLSRSPSHLSEALSGADRRKFDVDDLEAYIEATGDTTPIQYLAAKFLRDPAVAQQEALNRLVGLAETLPGLLAAAGLQKQGRAR